jgi:hypothetical protein
MTHVEDDVEIYFSTLCVQDDKAEEEDSEDEKYNSRQLQGLKGVDRMIYRRVCQCSIIVT